jgi:hypothetical protein
LFIAGVLFDFFAQSARRRALQVVAYYNLLGAAISTVPVVATRNLAWQFQLARGAKTQRRSAHAFGSGLDVGDSHLACMGAA